MESTFAAALRNRLNLNLDFGHAPSLGLLDLHLDKLLFVARLTQVALEISE